MDDALIRLGGMPFPSVFFVAPSCGVVEVVQDWQERRAFEDNLAKSVPGTKSASGSAGGHGAGRQGCLVSRELIDKS